MDGLESPDCVKLTVLKSDGEVRELKKIDPGQCCYIETFFHALKPGKYAIQANFNYNEGKPIIIETSTLVESKMELVFNMSIAMLAYTLTRLSLKLILE